MSHLAQVVLPQVRSCAKLPAPPETHAATLVEAPGLLPEALSPTLLLSLLPFLVGLDARKAAWTLLSRAISWWACLALFSLG